MRRSIIFFAIFTMLVLTGASCVSSSGSTSGPMGMYRSSDKGEAWSSISAFPSTKGVLSIAGLKVFRVYTDPSDPNAMYVTTRGQGLFYTYNNGDSWQSVTAMAGKFLYGLAVDPEDKCTIYVADESHIYKTDDCSRTWKMIYTEERTSERFVALAIDFKDNKSIYVAQLGGDILASRDAGKSWKTIKRFGFYLQQLIADPLTPGRLYLGTYRNGLYRSDDQGKTWSDLSYGEGVFSGGKEFYRLILNPAKKDNIYWLCKYGILYSEDAGLSWSDYKLLSPPGSVNIYAFAVNPKDPKQIYYTGTILGENNTHVRSTFYKSTDGGVNWVTKKLPTNTIPNAILIHPNDPNVLFMSFTTFQ